MAGETLIKALENYAAEDLADLKRIVLDARADVARYQAQEIDPTLRMLIGMSTYSINASEQLLLERLGRGLWNLYQYYKEENEKEQADADSN